jgi:5'-nucleotidase (lipoprotein e(P4) family)
MHRLILIFFPIVLWSQNPTNFNNLNELPNEIKWVTQSKEYINLCQQIYQTAIIAVRQQSQGNINPFIVMDLDETVLDNSKYQIELHLNKESYNLDSWNQWVKTEVSELVPGAKEFIIEYKKNPYARIIYLSNRDHKTLDATKSNMKKLGLDIKDDIFLLRKNKEDIKVVRRKEISDGTKRMKAYGPQKVIAYFGDAVGDFPDNEEYRFGRNKFIFPNPMYGKW